MSAHTLDILQNGISADTQRAAWIGIKIALLAKRIADKEAFHPNLRPRSFQLRE
jgi:hypothetical protein